MALDQSKFYEILAKDLIKLLKDNDDHDMVITAGEEPDVRTFNVHSNILRARSTYFSTSMSEIWIRRKNGIIQFNKPNISPEVFEIILGYIYGGKTFEDNLDPSIIFDCVMAADELGIIEFLHYAQDYLLIKKIKWLKENLALIYRDSFGLESIRKLQEFSVDRIKKYPYLLFDSDDFPVISEEALIAIIKDDELEMEEVKIWEKLIQWGIAKTPNLPSNLADWSAEDHALLGRTLKNCIEHIRFHNMDGNEFLAKVAPYKVLDTEYDRITGYFPELFGKSANAKGSHESKNIMKKKLPSREAIMSTIMSSSHAAMIASWIDRKDLTANQETGGSEAIVERTFQPYLPPEIPYRFNLLVRGSRDGFSAKTFHSKCDEKRSTVTLFKLQDHDIFVGGYNPGTWPSAMWPQYKKDDKAFVFSFTQGGSGANQGKIGRLTSAESCGYALNCWRSSGPSFGNLDLLMLGQKLTFRHKTYIPNVMPFDDKTVITEDYEVFEVVEKVKSGKDAESIEG